MMSNLSCGIDFGTSNTVVSLVDQSGKIVDFFSVPSTIYFFKESFGVSKVLIGEEATQYYVNKKQGRIINSIKSSLSDHLLKSTTINHSKLTVAEIVSLFLKEIRYRVLQKTESMPDRIVAGHPVRFADQDAHHELAKNRLQEAFTLAGFEAVEFIEEPLGAAYSLLNRPEFSLYAHQNQKILLGDLGGGTSDFTVIELEQGSIKVLAMAGIPIAGNKVDEMIMSLLVSQSLGRGTYYESYGKRLIMPVHYYNDISKWKNLFYLDRKKIKDDLENIFPSAEFPSRLKLFIKVLEEDKNLHALAQTEQVKIQLQDMEVVPYPFSFVDHKHIRGISQEAYLEHTEDLVKKITRRVEDMFKENSLKNDDIKFVFLTGGSSRLKSVQAALKAVFPKASHLSDKNQFTAISTGYAFYSLANQDKAS
jgi:hypothetical chaperone protein